MSVSPGTIFPATIKTHVENGAQGSDGHHRRARRAPRPRATRNRHGRRESWGAARRDLQLIGLDEDGRVALEVFFDIEDIDAATAELDAAHARFEQERPRSPLENAASRADDRVNALFAERRWDEIDALLGDDVRVDDRRRGLRREGDDHAAEVANARVIADIGVKTMTSQVLAIRGERLVLTRTVFSGRDQRPEAFHTELLRIAEIDVHERIVAYLAFDIDDFDAAMAELDTRFLAGEAAANAQTWSVIAKAYAELNQQTLPPTTSAFESIDHRRAVPFAPGDSSNTSVLHGISA